MRIMVVDDEEPILHLIQASVAGPDYELLPFLDSRHAADMLKREKFDGVLADVRMPFLDGIELTKIVRESPVNSRIPVVLISGSHDGSARQKGFQAGASGFLGKPFGPKELFCLLRAMRDPQQRENRLNGRLAYISTLACQIDREGGERFEATSLNISEGGMLVRSLTGLHMGQQFVMQFALPDGTEINYVRVLVIRRDLEARATVVFTGIHAENHKAIKRFFATQAGGNSQCPESA